MREISMRHLTKKKKKSFSAVSARSRTSTDTDLVWTTAFQTFSMNWENTGTESRRQLDTAQPVKLPSALLTHHIFSKDFTQKLDARLPYARKIPTAKSERIQAIQPAKTCPKPCGNICQLLFRSQKQKEKSYILSLI